MMDLPAVKGKTWSLKARDKSLDQCLTLCWENISHRSGACLRYRYSIQSPDEGCKVYPLSLVWLLNGQMHLSPPFLQPLSLIADSPLIISSSFRCVGLKRWGSYLIMAFLSSLSHFQVYWARPRPAEDISVSGSFILPPTDLLLCVCDICRNRWCIAGWIQKRKTRTSN